MLTSKQRAKLRGIASTYGAIFQIGKNGIEPPLPDAISRALDKRELIKIHVLETAPLSVHEAATEIADAVKAEVVAVTGRRFVLFRRNRKKPVVKL